MNGRCVLLPMFFCLFSCSMPSKHEVFFLNGICIKPFDGYTYKTCGNVQVRVDDRLVVIPGGFETDLASIPRIMWVLLAPSYSELIAPSVLHDYLYRDPSWMNRKEVDDVFFHAMLREGIDKWVAWRIWEAVRLFGNRFFAT